MSSLCREHSVRAEIAVHAESLAISLAERSFEDESFAFVQPPRRVLRHDFEVRAVRAEIIEGARDHPAQRIRADAAPRRDRDNADELGQPFIVQVQHPQADRRLAVEDDAVLAIDILDLAPNLLLGWYVHERAGVRSSVQGDDEGGIGRDDETVRVVSGLRFRLRDIGGAPRAAARAPS